MTLTKSILNGSHRAWFTPSEHPLKRMYYNIEGWKNDSASEKGYLVTLK